MRTQAWIVTGAKPDADINVIDVEIANFVSNIKAKLNGRVEFAKLLDAAHQPFGCKLRVHRDLQLIRAARRLERLGSGAVKPGKRISCRLGKYCPGFSQTDRPAGTDKQLHAKLIFDFLDLETYRCWRQAKLICGTSEVEMFGRRQQGPQGTCPGYLAHVIFKKILLMSQELLVSFIGVNA